MARGFQPLTFAGVGSAWDHGLVPAAGELAAIPREDGVQIALSAAAREAEERRAKEHDAALSALAEQQDLLEETEQRMAAIATRLEEERTGLFREAREGLASLILVAARRMAGDALRDDPALLEALIDEGLRALGEDGLTLRVSLADYDRVQERMGFGAVLVVPDLEIDGGCACEGPAGRIDATMATAEAAVAAVLARWAER